MLRTYFALKKIGDYQNSMLLAQFFHVGLGRELVSGISG